MYLSIILSAACLALARAQDLVSALKADPELSTLLAALEAIPDVTAAVASAVNITIFAPTNDAFDAFPAAADALMNNSTDLIAALISYHVVNATLTSEFFGETATYVNTLLGPEALVDGCPVTNVTEGQNIGLVLNGTCAQILSGQGTVSTVTEADIQVGCITVHKIDTVLAIPLSLTTVGTAANLTAAVGALEATELSDIVDTTADITIFVPANAAFEAIADTIAGLSVEEIATILEYHVIAGSVLFSSDLSSTTVPSLQGADLTVTVSDSRVCINNATVIIPDVLIYNGVAHIIDQVLIPPVKGY